MRSQHNERSISTEDAQKIVLTELKERGLEWKIESLGDNPITHRVRIYDFTGREVALGNGKGLGAQSKTSALFEAYEHYLTTTNSKFINLTSNIEFLTVEEVSSFDKVAHEKPLELLLKQNPKEKIACQRFIGLNGSDEIFYPLFLTTSDYFRFPIRGDDFDYGIAAKYCSNSGSAIGIGFEEAAIHALGEVLERDAHSTFLLKTFIRDEPEPIRIVEKVTIPQYLHEIVSTIEAFYGTELVIINIENDFKIPAFCVTFSHPSWHKPSTGAGVSLSKEYALERAILESLQVAHIYSLEDDLYITQDKQITARVKPLPKYYDCVMHRVDKLIAQEHFIMQNYGELPDHHLPSSLTDYLHAIDRLIENNGYKAFVGVNHSSSHGIVCLNAIIPGTEKFFLVHLGVLALPGERGRRILTEPTSSQSLSGYPSLTNQRNAPIVPQTCCKLGRRA